MGLSFAIDALYQTGWQPEGSQHEVAADGRVYPTAAELKRAFAVAGFELAVRHVQLFDCFRAEWSDASGQAGAVVGQSAEEAAVYALSQLRRQLSKQLDEVHA